MILVILPLGKEAKDFWDWVARVIMYTAASTLGGAAMAFIMGFIGIGLHQILPPLPVELVVLLVGLAALLYALHEMRILHLPNPQLAWQVPKFWQRPSRLVGNTLYGFVLGMGIFTFIPFASFYVLLALEALAGAMDLRAAVVIGMVYGVMRGLPTVVGGISMMRGTYPLSIDDWLVAHMGWWHAINAFALLVFGAFFVGSLVI